MPTTIGYPKDTAQKLRTHTAERLVVDAQTKLDRGQDYRSTEREALWEQSERQYDGDHWRTANPDPESDRIVINVSGSTIDTIAPYTSGSSPSFMVEPHSGNANQLNAAIQQAFLNRLWRLSDTRAQPSLERASWDALVYGDGFVMAGYDIEEKRVSDGEDYAEVASLWVDRVRPWDVWIDPSADGLYNARWFARRFYLTRSELDQDKRYFNKDEDNVTVVTGDRPDDDTDRTGFGVDTYDGSEWVELYEFHDAVARSTIVFSKDSRFPLRWIEEVGSFPIVQIGNKVIPNSPYHKGELENLWGPQQELNKTRSQMITHRRRDVAKVIARKEALDDDALRALRSPAVLEAVLVDTDGDALSDVLMPLQTTSLSADVYNISAIAKEDMYEISGIGEYTRGVSPSVRKTATEATILEGSANTKTQAKLRMVEEAARQIGRLLLQMASEVFPQTDYDEWELYLTGREAERVQRSLINAQAIESEADPMQGPDQLREIRNQPVEQDVTIKPGAEIFTGEYEVFVEASSTELRNPVLREQKAREMLMTIVNLLPALQQSGVQVNLKRVLELWLEAANVADIDAIFEVDEASQMQGLEALLGGGGAGGQPTAGISPSPGGPNLSAAQPPSDLPSTENSGILDAVAASA